MSCLSAAAAYTRLANSCSQKVYSDTLLALVVSVRQNVNHVPVPLQSLNPKICTLRRNQLQQEHLGAAAEGVALWRRRPVHKITNKGRQETKGHDRENKFDLTPSCLELSGR